MRNVGQVGNLRPIVNRPVRGTSMHRLLISILIAACALSQTPTKRPPRKPAPKPAETAPAPLDPSKWPLETFTVKGTSKYTRDQILALSGLRIGQTVAKADFDAARDRMVASGAFTSVTCGFQPAPDGKGYTALFEVVEVPELYPLHVEDLPIGDADLLAFAKQKDPLAGPKIPGTKEALERYKGIVAELLASKNYHEPVSGKLISEVAPDLIVLFRPMTPQPSVSHVKFTGSAAIHAAILQNAMLDVARGLPYSEAGFRQQLDANVRPLYDAKGYVRVSFGKLTTEPDPTVKGVIVTVEVKEGPVYKLGAVHVSGVGAERESEMVNLADLKKGEAVNFDLVKTATQRMEHTLRRDGYLQVASTPERRYDDAAKTIDLTLRIVPGSQFTFAKLNVANLDIETEPVIRKMWGLGEGKPFNVDYPQHFLDRVKEGGVFDNLKNTRFENKIDPDKHTVEVTLYFNEKLQTPKP
jgi:outer membrane protein insertion porin family